LQIQADAVVAYANLSAALAGQNKPEEALHVLQQGLQVRPSAWLYGNLGNTLFLQGDYAGAAAAFEAAVAPARGNPADYLGWANLADTLIWIPGRETDARAAYARAGELLAPRLARAPHDVTLLSRMSLYFARTGDKQQCENLLQQVLALAPDGAEVQFRASLAYELIGERKRALTAIARAARLGYPTKFIDAAPELIALRRDADYGPPR
jgi:tetratricopeptide (TPR) repeat protein